MTNAEHIAALQADADEDMNALGNALAEAYRLARKLEGRSVNMALLGLPVPCIKDLRDAAENAYTLNRVKVPG